MSSLLGIAEAGLVLARTIAEGLTQFKSRVAIMDQEFFNFVEFDALISATYSGASQVTDHPVEGSLDVTDHIRRQPVEVQLRAVVSNTPIMMLASLRSLPNGALPADIGSRAEEAFNFFESIRVAAQLCHISTLWWDLEDMALVSLSCTRDKESGNIAALDLGFREVLVAQTQIVKVDIPGVSRGKIGTITKKVATAPVAASSSSLLFKIFSLF